MSFDALLALFQQRIPAHPWAQIASYLLVLVLIAVVAAAVAALLWRWFIRVHTRMQVALLDTLDNHKDSPGH